MSLPLAHAGHWTWAFYLLPVLIVIGGIVRGALQERRRKQGGGKRDTKAEQAKAKKRRSR